MTLTSFLEISISGKFERESYFCLSVSKSYFLSPTFRFGWLQKVKVSPIVSVSLGPTFAVTNSAFISDKPCIPATDMTDSLPSNRSKKTKLRSINDTVDPVSQSAIVSTHLLSLPIEMGINCKNPQSPVESIEELPALFWDLGSSDLFSFSDFSKSTCNIRLCFFVHPLTPHTRSDLQSLIKCEFKQQKQSFDFFKVSYLSLALCYLNLLHIQSLWSPSFRGHCFNVVVFSFVC